ncbi:hypothetical protein [Halobacteriovorax sp. RT-2-4]|uniref:hypothetical protein n=1 Tax=Halobacteriovorax sp. RT-2-4 TaxID=3391165 RepID=UPI00399B9FA7
MSKSTSDIGSIDGVYMGGNKPQDAAAKSVESGFSENELDDIMAEFASLDKELSGQLDSAPVAEVIEESVAESAPVEEFAVEVNPLDALEAQANPLDEMVAESNPLDEMVAESNPLDEMVAESNPLDEMVAESNPLDEVVAEVEEVFEEETTQIVAQEDIEEAVAGDSSPSLEEAFTEGFDEAEMDAIMKDLEEIDAASPTTTLEMEEEPAANAQSTVIKDEDNENILVINQAPKETPAPSFTHVAPTTSESGDVTFSAAGNMNFNVNLTIAGSQATLSVVDGRFTLTMNGVDVSITEEGFKACIEGGANFNIPLPSAEEAKKVA